MEFVNDSAHVVYGHIHTALPLSKDNTVAQLPKSGGSVDLQPGSYYCFIAADNVGPLPAGTTIAQTGGVTEASTVTLAANDRIVVT